MSEFNVTVDSGNSIRLKTAGKYCDRDIVVTAEGGDELDKLLSNQLTTLDSNATSVKKYTLYGSNKLDSVNLPNAMIIGTYALGGCPKLRYVDLHKAKSIEANAFNACYQLTALILRSSTMVTLENTNAFTNCYHILGTTNSTYNPNGDKDGYFYVPRSLVDNTYKAATNWSTYSTQFRALEDYTVDGTTTGELDWEKVNA